MSLPALNDKADDTVSRVARYPVSNPWATTKQVLKLMASRRSSVQGPVSKSDPLCQVALSCSRKPSHFACTGNVPSPCYPLPQMSLFGYLWPFAIFSVKVELLIQPVQGSVRLQGIVDSS